MYILLCHGIRGYPMQNCLLQILKKKKCHLKINSNNNIVLVKKKTRQYTCAMMEIAIRVLRGRFDGFISARGIN
jgi:hypothetical protein